jgi:predicted PhzF superfamily epimerase YddE/YHI9
MHSIAIENSTTTTAFYVKEGDGFHIRWFTPTIELQLNGNATMAVAHVLIQHQGYTGTKYILIQRAAN